MFGVFTWQFPAGLAVYILFSNIIGIFIQYFVGGKQPIMLFGKLFFGTEESRSIYLQKLSDQKNSVNNKKQIETNKEETDEPKDIQRENSRRSKIKTPHKYKTQTKTLTSTKT